MPLLSDPLCDPHTNTCVASPDAFSLAQNLLFSQGCDGKHGDVEKTKGEQAIYCQVHKESCARDLSWCRVQTQSKQH